jgi:Flp pilus assembly protein TadG
MLHSREDHERLRNGRPALARSHSTYHDTNRRPPDRSLCGRRDGVVAIEFAVVAPVLLLLVFGCIDFGRSIMVLDLLSQAARTGCRTGTLSGNGNNEINSAVSTALISAGITGAPNPAIDVLPQGSQSWVSPGDAGAAVKGDSIRVTVSIKYTQVTWLAFNWFMPPNASLSSRVVMNKE